MTFRTMTLADAIAVCTAMREEDRACVDAMVGDVEPEAMAVSRWSTNGPAWTLLQDNAPVAVGGLSFTNDWIGVLWLFATPAATRESWKKLLRMGRTVLANAGSPEHPQYRHRVEAHVLVGWRGAFRFAECLGLELEGRRSGVGRSGESVDVWVRLGPPKGTA